jgi:hypothetical protein
MYIKRKAELYSKLDEAVLKMSGREITSKKDQEQIREAVYKYFVQYQKTLEEAINFLKDDTKTSLQQRERWEDHFHTKETANLQILIECIKGKPPTLFTNAIADLITQDSVFYLRLSNMQLPDIMKGKLLEYKKEFEVEKESLMDKWERLLYDNNNINASIDEISEKLRNVYKEGLKKVDAAHTKLKEELALYIKTLQVINASFAIPYDLRIQMGYITETINNFKVTSQDLAYRFDQLYKNEESVAVIMFGNTRRSVKEFLEKTNLEKAQKDYNEAEKYAYENAKNMLTSGQKEDAELFVRTATDITKIAMQSFTDAYNAFVNEFREIFIGPVGDRTVYDLIKRERWDRAKNEWQVINIETELKKLYDDSKEWISLDIFDLDAETENKVEDALKQDRESLELALRNASDPGILDKLENFYTLVKDQIGNEIKRS